MSTISNYNIINGSMWEAVVGNDLFYHLNLSIQDEPRFTNDVYGPIAEDLAAHVENAEGVCVLTIPKGLSYENLLCIAASKGMPATHIWAPIKEAMKDFVVPHTYVAVVSNALFEQTRNKSFADQERIVKDYQYEVSGFIETLALSIITYLKSTQFIECEDKKCLFPHEPLTYARTPLVVKGNHVMLGNFDETGCFIAKSFYDREATGVSAMKILDRNLARPY